MRLNVSSRGKYTSSEARRTSFDFMQAAIFNALLSVDSDGSGRRLCATELLTRST